MAAALQGGAEESWGGLHNTMQSSTGRHKPANVSLQFSATQLRNLGVDLPFSFMSDAKLADPRFVETAEEVAYWEQVGGMMRCLSLAVGGGWGATPVQLSARRYQCKPPTWVHPICPNGLYPQVSALKPGDELPEDLMRRFYFTPYALLRCGRYVDRIQPFLNHFKPEKCGLGHCSAGWWVQ